MLEYGTLFTVEESTLSLVEEGSLSVCGGGRAVVEGTSSTLQSHLSTEVQMALAAVNLTTPEKKTAVSQRRSVGSSHNPLIEEHISFITCDVGFFVAWVNFTEIITNASTSIQKVLGNIHK